MTTTSTRMPVAVYCYTDEQGAPLYEVLRFEPKDFLQRRPLADGSYEWNLNGVRRVPYRLQKLRERIAKGHTVFVVEGEKDTDTLTALGFCATTNCGGANWKWTPEFIECFRGAPRIVVIPDCDEGDPTKGATKGREAAREHAQLLLTVCEDVRLADLDADRRDGYDVSNWIREGHTAADLRELAEAAPHLEPETASASDGGDRAAAESAGNEAIKRLASLSEIDYAHQRKRIARDLAMPVALLDKAVRRAARESLDLAAAASSVEPRSASSAAPPADATSANAAEPPIDGAELLDGLYAFVLRFVVLSDAQAVAVALWVVHTHAFEAAESTPYLAINSAEKRCGKTRLLEVLDLLVARAWLTGRTTAAALVRKVSSDRATLLLDESDAAFGGEKTYAEALRGILNSGHRRGGSATLNIPSGDGWEATAFDVFSPKAIAGIGKLPDTVVDRSIAIALHRRKASELVDRFRRRKIAPEADRLRRATAAWAHANLDALREAEPQLPDELDDRSQDGWEPLLVIADQIGGAWAERARAAALALSGDRAVEDESIGVQLLRDVKRVFDETATDRLHTEHLLLGLHAIAESPWATWRNGQPMGPHPLAMRLRGYEIKSRQVKIEGSNRHGYLRADFVDAFDRYLAGSSLRNATGATTQSYQGFAAQNDPLPEGPGSVTESAAKPCKHREVAPVALRSPISGSSGEGEGVSGDFDWIAEDADGSRAGAEGDADSAPAADPSKAFLSVCAKCGARTAYLTVERLCAACAKLKKAVGSHAEAARQIAVERAQREASEPNEEALFAAGLVGEDVW